MFMTPGMEPTDKHLITCGITVQRRESHPGPVCFAFMDFRVSAESSRVHPHLPADDAAEGVHDGVVFGLIRKQRGKQKESFVEHFSMIYCYRSCCYNDVGCDRDEACN